MLHRNFNVPSECPLCEGCMLETAKHMLFECNFAISVWNELMKRKRYTFTLDGDSVQEIWRKISGFGAARRNITVLVSTIWSIWKCHNLKIFQGKVSQPSQVAEWIIHEATLWKTYCRGNGTKLISTGTASAIRGIGIVEM